jgi:hypothetical protein
MSPELQDELMIRRLIERWAVWRDAGDWERFATVWHPDGVMMATWFQGPFTDFIRVTQEGWARGVSILHFLGGSAIEIAGDRAIAQTKMTLSQRGLVEGAMCDVVCTGLLRLRRAPRGRVEAATSPADLREGPHRPAGPGRVAEARRGRARGVSRRLPPPRLHPDAHRLPGQARHADAQSPEVEALYWRGARWLAWAARWSADVRRRDPTAASSTRRTRR